MQKAHLTLIDGPMFADKTTTLIELIKSRADKYDAFDIIKPTTDNRYAKGELVSHNGLRYPAKEIEPDKLLQYTRVIKAFSDKLIQIVFIDEGHFFKDLYESVQICLNYGVSVVVSGINIDYMRNPFPEMKKLESIAKTHIICNAYCNECGKLARFTKIRPEVDRPADSSIVVVGGADKYAPYCGSDECYIWRS